MFHWKWLAKFNSPPTCYRLLDRIAPWCGILFVGLFTIGLYGAWAVPKDYQQGEVFRILYIHVPAAFLSLSTYIYMAFAAAIALIWRTKLAFVIVRAAAPIGASFTLIALFTGAVWGKPTWGTWWVWDARLTSELLLLFLYLGVILLGNAIEDLKKADEASCLLALVGVINVPIIHYSVQWWFTLHQGQTLSLSAPKIHHSMIAPLYTMIAAAFCYLFWLLMRRVQLELIKREHKTRWVQALTEGQSS